MSAVEGYLSLSDCHAVVVEPLQLDGNSVIVTSQLKENSWVISALKVVSWIATCGLFPLIALCIKAIHRCSHEYHYSTEAAKNLANTALQLFNLQNAIKNRDLKGAFNAAQNELATNSEQRRNLKDLTVKALIDMDPYIAKQINDYQQGKISRETLGANVLNLLIANPKPIQKLIGQFLKTAEEAAPELEQALQGVQQIVQNHPALFTTFFQQCRDLRQENLSPEHGVANLLEYLAENPQIIQDLIGVAAQAGDIIPPNIQHNIQQILLFFQNTPRSSLQHSLKQMAHIFRNAEDLEGALEGAMDVLKNYSQ